MSIIDIAIILMVLMFAVVGFKKGVIKEVISLIGIIIVFVLSFMFKEQIGNVLCKFLPFFTFNGNLKGLVSLNILIYQLIGFLIIYSILFGIYTIILKISGIFQKLVNMTIVLLLPSKIGGAILGAIEGYFLTYIVLMILMTPFNNAPIFRDSFLLNKMIYKTPIISKYTSNVTNTIKDTHNLANDIVNNSLTVNEANLKIIDNMLNYKIVSKKTVEQLIVLDKLKDVSGLDKVLKKYN